MPSGYTIFRSLHKCAGFSRICRCHLKGTGSELVISRGLQNALWALFCNVTSMRSCKISGLQISGWGGLRYLDRLKMPSQAVYAYRQTQPGSGSSMSEYPHNKRLAMRALCEEEKPRSPAGHNSKRRFGGRSVKTIA